MEFPKTIPYVVLGLEFHNMGTLSGGVDESSQILLAFWQLETEGWHSVVVQDAKRTVLNHSPPVLK